MHHKWKEKFHVKNYFEKIIRKSLIAKNDMLTLIGKPIFNFAHREKNVFYQFIHQ